MRRWRIERRINDTCGSGCAWFALARLRLSALNERARRLVAPIWNSANVASIALLAPADHTRQYKRTISEGLVTCS
jgi:hypothetical protein